MFETTQEGSAYIAEEGARALTSGVGKVIAVGNPCLEVSASRDRGDNGQKDGERELGHVDENGSEAVMTRESVDGKTCTMIGRL
jgi:hypothetical protein